MRILLSNDDGIHAPGLKVLERIARELSDDVWVVAPEIEHSGAGHSLTLRRPLRVHKISPRRFSVDGTPTDCIMVACSKIMEDKLPDLVLSGVNLGKNVGEDVTYSGTVAAAMEATLLGIPSIALSQAKHAHSMKWSTVETHAPDIIRKLLDQGWPKEVLININFPDLITSSVKGVQVVRQGLRSIRQNMVESFDPRGNPVLWVGEARDSKEINGKNDLSVINEGYIAITPLHLDLTHYETLEHLEKTLSFEV